jgi:multisubunit Na+/H+ antiporter MnhB subunit
MTPTTGRKIAFAAVLVQAPRLILALLAADREPVGLEWQRGLLVVAGLGTAVVLTGGNLSRRSPRNCNADKRSKKSAQPGGTYSMTPINAYHPISIDHIA